MKKSILYKCMVVAAALLATFNTTLQAQVKTKDSGNLRWAYTDGGTKLNREARTMQFAVTAKMLERLATQEMVVIKPEFVSKDGKKKVSFDPVLVVGATRYKILNRYKKLDPTKLPEIKEYLKASDVWKTGLTFKKEVPYERWMKTANFTVSEDYFGCAACDKGFSEGNPLQAAIPSFNPEDFAFQSYVPQYNPDEFADVNFESRVNFEVNKADIKANFMDNRRELSRIDEFITNSLKVKSGSLQNMMVKSYASPESNMDYNLELTQRRAAALANYIKGKFARLKGANINMEGMGEDWDGLLRQINEGSMDGKDQILEVLNGSGTQDERERAMRKVGDGSYYKFMMDNYYPTLRRSNFTVTYKVLQLKDEDLMEAWKTEKEVMSHADMYRVAKKLAGQTDKELEVYKVAFERFGDKDPLAALNYASKLIEYKKDGQTALRVLEKVKDDKRSLFLTAMAYQCLDDEFRAEDYLERAAKAGDADAVKVYNKYFKK